MPLFLLSKFYPSEREIALVLLPKLASCSEQVYTTHGEIHDVGFQKQKLTT